MCTRMVQYPVTVAPSIVETTNKKGVPLYIGLHILNYFRSDLFIYLGTHSGWCTEIELWYESVANHLICRFEECRMILVN